MTSKSLRILTLVGSTFPSSVSTSVFLSTIFTPKKFAI
nr:MAG TPA: hypothetical protein [Caudoviricetes sp.]